MFGKIFACLHLVKFNIDFVVIVFRRLETQDVPGANFGYIGTMLGSTFHSLFLSQQTLMYDSDEYKPNGNLSMQNAIGTETLAAPIYKENPNAIVPSGTFCEQSITD